MSAIVKAELKVTKNTSFTMKNKRRAVAMVKIVVALFLDKHKNAAPSAVDCSTKNHVSSNATTIIMVWGFSIVARSVITITIAATRR